MSAPPPCPRCGGPLEDVWVYILPTETEAGKTPDEAYGPVQRAVCRGHCWTIWHNGTLMDNIPASAALIEIAQLIETNGAKTDLDDILTIISAATE